MKMDEYTEIRSSKELDMLLNETVSFQDSIVKELQMINRGYVMEDKSMNMGHRFDAKILFQSQNEPIAFELLCLDTKHLSSTEPGEFLGGSGKFFEAPEQFIELSLDGEFVVKCKRLFYKFAQEFFGNNEHLGSQVPSLEMASAKMLKDEWRQCGNCGDAWEVSFTRKVATCPSCNQVTCLCT